MRFSVSVLAPGSGPEETRGGLRWRVLRGQVENIGNRDSQERDRFMAWYIRGLGFGGD